MTYDLLSQLGEGGFGTVFLAREKEEGKLVAIKRSQSRWYSLEHERSILAQLQHVDGIAHLLTTIEDNNSKNNEPGLSLVLEYIEGTRFMDVEKHSLPFSTVLQYIQELFTIIENIHAQGIIHNDLYGRNILCGTDGHVYLIDFGLARIASTSMESRRMFCYEVAAMTYVAQSWLSYLTNETTPCTRKLLTWLDTAYNTSRKEENGTTALSFIASWQHMLQVVTQEHSSTDRVPHRNAL